MAASTLQTVTSNLRMRWRETYVSEGLNLKMTAMAAGIYRGFAVVDSGQGNSSIVIQADATRGDNVAIYETEGSSITNRYSLTINIPGNLPAMSLTAYAGGTATITLEATYATGVDSTASINAYAAGATIPTGAIILAVCTVPSTPGTVTVAYTGRTSAWVNQNPEAQRWSPVLKNGGFESTNNGTSVIGMSVDFWRMDTTGVFVPTASSPNSGKRAVLIGAPSSSPVTAYFYQLLRTPITSSQYVRIMMSKQVNTAPTVGTANLFVEWADENGAVLGTSTYTFSSTGSGTDGGAYKAVDWTVSPSNTSTAYINRIGIYLNGYGFGTTQSNGCEIDDIQAYVEPLGVNSLPAVDERRGDLVTTGLMIADPTGTDQTSDIAGLITFDHTYNSNATGQFNFGNRGSLQGPAVALAQALIGSSIVTTAPTTPRLTMPFDAGAASYSHISSIDDATHAESAIHLYVYGSTTAGSNPAGYAIAVNCYWDSTTTSWKYAHDTATTPASLYKFDVVNGLQMHTYAGGQTNGWTDSAWTSLPLDFPQITEPTVPTAITTGRVFVRSNGGVSNSTLRSQLCVKWHDGTVTVIAESPVHA